MRWLCRNCLSEFDERPPACGGCFDPGFLVALPVKLDGRELVTSPRKRAGVVPVAKLRVTDARLCYGEPWDAWALGLPSVLLVVGAPGSGKSHVLTSMAVGAARRGNDVLLVAAEEGHSASLGKRLERVGLDDLAARRLRVSDARTYGELNEDLRENVGASVVVLDSVSELAISPEGLTALLLGRSWVGSLHINSRGSARGGPAWEHLGDVVVAVEDGVAVPTKNRFGPHEPLQIPGYRRLG